MAYDIVVFVPSDWMVVRGLPENTAMGFARAGHRVLVVEPFYNVSSLFRVARMQARSVDWRQGVRQVEERLWVYRPPPLGVPGRSRTPVAARSSAVLLGQLVARTCRRLGFDRPVVWSFLYDIGRAFAAFPGPCIYESGDYEGALARSDSQRSTVRTMEAETCGLADAVVACTDELAEVLRPHNRRTSAIYCAADVDFFATARDPALAVPDSIARLPRPVIGYMGGLDPFKIDVALIRAIAEARPDWSIALVGYVWFGFDAAVFAGLPNVHVLGPQDYADFPGFLKGMDVGLLPFADHLITRHGDALKCYEYLAAGLPVVGRPVPVIRRLATLVHRAETAEDFVARIEDALAEGEAERAARRAAIPAHDWSVRVAQKLALIDGLRTEADAPLRTGAAVA